MRAIHIVPDIGEEASGPSYAVPRLCESLIATGVEVDLAVLTGGSGADRRSYVKTFAHGLGPRRLGASPAMRRWLRAELRAGEVDIVHSHGLWMMPNVYAGAVVRRSSSRLVVSPHGTLAERALGISRLRKKVFWCLAQRRVLRRAACLHATGAGELDDIRRMGLRQPVCVIPHGIDMPQPGGRAEPAVRRVLYLGRIHPIKGLEDLLRAWREVQFRHPDWELLVAGPDNQGYLSEMQALAVTLGLERVGFPGPVFGDDKQRAYRAASLYVLPTHSESFGVTVAEALAAGTPAIVTKGAPWEGLPTHGCGWWVDVGAKTLAATLSEAMALSADALQEMGRRGSRWMQSDFAWPAISRQMKDVYEWVLGGGSPPSSVATD